MRSPDYSRTMRHPFLVTGDGRARDALHDVIQSMSALTWMTRCMLLADDDGAGPFVADGVFSLFDQQCALLNGISSELDAEAKARADLVQAQIPREDIERRLRGDTKPVAKRAAKIA